MLKQMSWTVEPETGAIHRGPRVTKYTLRPVLSVPTTLHRWKTVINGVLRNAFEIYQLSSTEFVHRVAVSLYHKNLFWGKSIRTCLEKNASENVRCTPVYLIQNNLEA